MGKVVGRRVERIKRWERGGGNGRGVGGKVVGRMEGKGKLLEEVGGE